MEKIHLLLHHKEKAVPAYTPGRISSGEPIEPLPPSRSILVAQLLLPMAQGASLLQAGKIEIRPRAKIITSISLSS